MKNTKENYIRPEVNIFVIETEGILCSSTEETGTGNIEDITIESNWGTIWE